MLFGRFKPLQCVISLGEYCCVMSPWKATLRADRCFPIRKGAGEVCGRESGGMRDVDRAI